jgi:hypothetical protein
MLFFNQITDDMLYFGTAEQLLPHLAVWATFHVPQMLVVRLGPLLISVSIINSRVRPSTAIPVGGVLRRV